MPQQNTNDLNVWQNETPVVNPGVDLEFNTWQNESPDEDIDESVSSTIVSIRRRAFEF
jgi:hypothetical protein